MANGSHCALAHSRYGRYTSLVVRMLDNKVPDIMIANLPWWDMDLPYCAPALLKGIAVDQGFTTINRDFNVDLLYTICNGQISEYEKLALYFVNGENKVPAIDRFYELVVREIKHSQVKKIGISVFSVWTQRATYDLLLLLREQLPDLTVIVGGRGLSVPLHVSVVKSVAKRFQIENFANLLRKNKLADIIVEGDAEDVFVDILRSGPDQSLNCGTKLIASKKTLDYPFSNFDDVDFSKYTGTFDKIQIPVISSKGCVRNCDFCDVSTHMSTYMSKSGRRLAEEVIYLAKKYNTVNFVFTDSISNGNIRGLLETCNILADYNKSVEPHKRIKWAGQWIARPPGQITPEMFDLFKNSGLEHVVIGAESGSNYVLEKMNKKTTVEGLYYELDQIKRVGIQAMVNNIIGHWSEEYSHFIEHINMLLKIAPLVASNVIEQVYVGESFSVLQGTTAAKRQDISGITTDGSNFTQLWYSAKNPSLTMRVRLVRLILVYQLLFYLNIPLTMSNSRLRLMLSNIRSNAEYWNSWYKDVTSKSEFTTCPTIAFSDHFLDYIDTTISSIYTKTTIKVVVSGYTHRDDDPPNLIIKFNNTVLYSSSVVGQKELQFEVEYAATGVNCLSLEMDNKKVTDTIIDANGNIIRDKNIVFDLISVDDISITNDDDYFYRVVQLITPEGKVPTTKGLYRNATACIDFNGPFWKHYLQNKSHVNWRILSDREETKRVLKELLEVSLQFDV